MASQNAIVNPTQRQVNQAQQQAIDRAEELANTITGVSGPNQALVREILPDQDLEDGTDNGWNGSDREWVQAGLTADQTNVVYNVDSNQNAQDKVIVIYGFYNVASDVLTTDVEFQDGTGATFARFNVEALEVADVSDFIILENQIVYGSTENGDILQWPDAAGGDNMVFLAKVAEPLGETLSTRESASDRLAPRR